MFKLNEDILYLILEEFKDDNSALYSCLLTNRTWCKITVPILWKDPWKFLNYLKQRQMELLLNVIILHLSNESKKIILTDLLPFLKNPYLKPLFDYISFCRHLDLINIDNIIQKLIDIEEPKIILMNEIINLFINGNRKFTHLYIPYINYHIHLTPEARNCLSEIEFLFCKNINYDIIAGLAEICKSIKKLHFYIKDDDNYYGIIKLIESQENLFILNLRTYFFSKPSVRNRNLEKSLIKHTNTIQYLRIPNPYTNILTSSVNLKVLELYRGSNHTTWNCLENLSLPCLQILRTDSVPVKFLISLIESTSGYLTEIKIDNIHHNGIDNKRIIQFIYQKCPNLMFLKSVLRNDNILELKNLLVNCQNLNGLHITSSDHIFDMADDWDINDIMFDWDKLFEILVTSSPTSLFKFKFQVYTPIKLNSLKLFFDNWKDRHPIYLQINQMSEDIKMLIVEKYNPGIVKKFGDILNDVFEWN